MTLDSQITNGTRGVKEVLRPIGRSQGRFKQVYKPTEWNQYHVTLKGAHLKVVLNGETIQDLNLDEQTQSVKRHDGTPAPPVKDRPRKGHIGFQELSRGGAHVEIRYARLQALD